MGKKTISSQRYGETESGHCSNKAPIAAVVAVDDFVSEGGASLTLRFAAMSGGYLDTELSMAANSNIKGQ